jgi:zinc protease
MPHHRAVPPAVGEPAPLRMPRVERGRLSSGVDAYTVERRDLPVVDVQVVLRAGAAHDQPRLAGRAHMTSDMLDEGTASRGPLQVATEVEALGATLQTRASWDYAVASLHVLRRNLEPAMDLLADIVLRPAFDEAEFARKKRERLHAIAQERDDPRNLASAAFARLIYGAAHPYGTSIGGREETVQALDAGLLREFYASRYSPADAFIVITGDVDAEEAGRLLEQRFGEWATSSTPVPELPPPPPGSPTAVHIVHRDGAPQSELRVGHSGPPRHAGDYVALQVANTLLGGAFTSRLNILLREEKGYTYGAGSSFAFRKGGGPFLASTAVATEATADAVNDMVSEVARLVAEPVAEDELERARRYMVLGLPRTFETTADVAEHVADLALHGLPPDYYERYTEAVKATTPEAIREAAQRWLRPAELVVVVAGDGAAVRDELEELGIGAVHEYDDG